MSLENIRISRPNWLLRDAWRRCVLCCARATYVEAPFDNGTAEFAKGETVTGATSGDTGIVAEVELVSGSWAGGDAAGYLTLSSPTGLDSDGHWGEDNETITSTSGSATLNGKGTKKVQGFSYPQRDMVFADGRWYCRWHYNYRFKRKREDENVITIQDGGLHQ